MTLTAFMKCQGAQLLTRRGIFSLQSPGESGLDLGARKATLKWRGLHVSVGSMHGSGHNSAAAQRWHLPNGRSCSMFWPLGTAAAALSTGTAEPLWEMRERDVELSEFVLHGAKTTAIAHGLWRQVVKPGDTVVDATCGNGNDTLILARMVCTPDMLGSVYALDLQQNAVDKTSFLLDQELNPIHRNQVTVLQICHSQLQEVVSDTPVRLVAFNLGYLPGGDKSFITRVSTTIQALHAASNVLQQGGLISIVAYIGHPGGREEYEAVKEVGAALPADKWVCSHHEWINRPIGPRLIFLSKK